MKKSNRLLKCFLLIMCMVTIGIGINKAIVSYAEEEIRQPDYHDGAYYISTKGELRWYIDYVNNTNNCTNGVLVRSINIASTDIEQIGSEQNPFRGVFDGNGNKLIGYIGIGGFFKYSYGTIQNLRIEGGIINATPKSGAICNSNYGEIINCGTAIKVQGKEYVSGVCGYNRGTIDRCYNAGSVTGNNNVAGICADNEGRIVNCYNAGYIGLIDENDNVSNYIAGIALNNGGSIADSINYGEVYANNRYYLYAIGQSFDNCYSIQDEVDFSTGEITYLLNHKSTENVAWGQKLGKDDYPGFNNDIVYYGYDYCVLKYDNKELYSEPVHKYTDDWQFDDECHYYECTICQERKDEQRHDIPSWHHNDISTHCGDCTVCKNTFYRYHGWAIGDFMVKPTEDVNGVRFYHCQACSSTKETEVGYDIELPFLNKVEFFKKEGWFSDHDLCLIDAGDNRSGVKEVFYAYIKNNESIDDNIVDKVKWVKYDKEFEYDPTDYSSMYIKVVDRCNNFSILDSSCTTLYGNHAEGDKYYNIKDITSYPNKDK